MAEHHPTTGSRRAPKLPATPAHPTPGATGREPDPLPLPFPLTVEALGRLRVAAETRQLDLGEEKEEAERGPLPNSIGKAKRLRRAEALFSDRAIALRDLAFTIPARTLVDAVVHLGLAMEVAETLEPVTGPDGVQSDDRPVWLRRALASVFPLVVQAAGVDPRELLDGWCTQRHALEFGTATGGAQ